MCCCSQDASYSKCHRAKAWISVPFQSRILHGVYDEWVKLLKTLNVEIYICSSLPYQTVNCLVWHSNARRDPDYVENHSVGQRSFVVQLLLLQLCVVDKAHWMVTLKISYRKVFDLEGFESNQEPLVIESGNCSTCCSADYQTENNLRKQNSHKLCRLWAAQLIEIKTKCNVA